MEDTPAEDKKYCKNCKQDVPAVTFIMHEIHCQRHMRLCDICGLLVSRREYDDHYESEHTLTHCDKCGDEVLKGDLEEHKESSCPHRLVHCCYCDIELSYKSLAEHVDYCGSRTEACVKCGQYIMHKDRVKHDDSSCKYPEPAISNINDASSTTNMNYITELAKIDSLNFPTIGIMYFQENGQHSQARNSNLSGSLPKTKIKINKQTKVNDIKAYGYPSVSPNRFHNNVPCSREAAADTLSQVQNDLSRSPLKSRVPVMKTPEKKTGVEQLPYEESPQSNLLSNSKWFSRGSDRQKCKELPLRKNIGTSHKTDINRKSELNKMREYTQNVVSNGRYEDLTKVIYIPCEFCGMQFPNDGLIQHQIGCHPSVCLPKNTDSGLVDFDSTPSMDGKAYFWPPNWDPTQNAAEDELIPCEFCGDRLKLDFFMQHQFNCQWQQLDSTCLSEHRTLFNSELYKDASQFKPAPTNIHLEESGLQTRDCLQRQYNSRKIQAKSKDKAQGHYHKIAGCETTLSSLIKDVDSPTAALLAYQNTESKSRKSVKEDSNKSLQGVPSFKPGSKSSLPHAQGRLPQSDSERQQELPGNTASNAQGHNR